MLWLQMKHTNEANVHNFFSFHDVLANREGPKYIQDSEALQLNNARVSWVTLLRFELGFQPPGGA